MNRYTAFISYRHVEPDMTIAKKLHTLLETYHIPKNIKDSKGIDKVGRVFRDEEELLTSTDLSSDIHQALENSDWLIVICTPALLESRWCLEEIDTFIRLGKRDHILAVLVSGDSETSFPEQLKTITVDGEVRHIEPLAANIIASDIRESLKLLKNEKLRLLASILGVNYDDLKQRDRQRRMRSTYATIAAAFVLLTSFAGFVLYKNNEISKERNAALIAESKWLTKSANEALYQNNPTLALQLALEALPENFKSPERPVVEDAINTVYGAMFAKAQEGYKVISTIELENKRLNYFQVDTVSDKLYLFEEKQDFIDIYDIKTGELLETVDDEKSLNTTYYKHNKTLKALSEQFKNYENCYVLDYKDLNNQETEAMNYYDDDYLVKLGNYRDHSIDLIEVIEDEVMHYYHYQNTFVTYNTDTLGYGSSFDGRFVYGMVENNLVLFKASDEEIIKVLNYEDVDGFLFVQSAISEHGPLIAVTTRGGNGYLYNYLTDTLVKLENGNHTVDSLQFNYDGTKLLVLNDTGNTADIYLSETGELLYSINADFDVSAAKYGRRSSYYGSVYSDDLIVLKGSGVYQILRCDASSSNEAVIGVSNTVWYDYLKDYPLISEDGKTLWNLSYQSKNNIDVKLEAVDLESGEIVAVYDTRITYFKLYGGILKKQYLINYYPDEHENNVIDVYDASSTEKLFTVRPEIVLDEIKTTEYNIWNMAISDDLKTIIMYVSDTNRNNYYLVAMDLESSERYFQVNMREYESTNIYVNQLYTKDDNIVVFHRGTTDKAIISLIDMKTGERLAVVNPEERESQGLVYSSKDYHYFNDHNVYISNGALKDFETDERLIYLGEDVVLNDSTEDGKRLVVSRKDRVSSSSVNSGAIFVIKILDSQDLIDSAKKVLDGKELSMEEREKYFLN